MFLTLYAFNSSLFAQYPPLLSAPLSRFGPRHTISPKYQIGVFVNLLQCHKIEKGWNNNYSNNNDNKHSFSVVSVDLDWAVWLCLSETVWDSKFSNAYSKRNGYFIIRNKKYIHLDAADTVAIQHQQRRKTDQIVELLIPYYCICSMYSVQKCHLIHINIQIFYVRTYLFMLRRLHNIYTVQWTHSNSCSTELQQFHTIF